MFFPESNASARKMLGASATLLKIFEADSWEAASQMKHDFLGWEPYVPFDETALTTVWSAIERNHRPISQFRQVADVELGQTREPIIL